MVARRCSMWFAVCLVLLWQSSPLMHAAAQEVNGQGAILYKIGQWLSSNNAPTLDALGWKDGANPCNGWTGIGCNSEGYVTSINLSSRGLSGSIPSDPGLWAGLTGLTSLDLSDNSLGGQVPSAIKSAPLLTNVNLAGNKNICGYLPNNLNANTGGTSIGTDCQALSKAASPSPAQPASPSPAPAAASAPVATGPSSQAPSTAAPAATPAAPAATPPAGQQGKAAGNTSASTGVVAPPRPAAAPTVISKAPICSCALQGFASADCAGALAAVCRGPSPPEVCNSTDRVSTEPSAAVQLGRYLAASCFTGQDMDTSICSCVQNLLGNDCAKARVSLCVKNDTLCLPLQSVIDDAGSTTAEAAQQVSAALTSTCPVVEPTQPGVKATMEFPDISMGQYISRQYTQNVANALSSVTNVPTSSISTLDVRPLVSNSTSSSGSTPKRLLLQVSTSSSGVQATYFLAAEDPAVVSQRLSTAASDGTLSSRLAQYGITAQAGGLRVQNYLNAPPALPAAPGGGSGNGSNSTSSFPLWALAVIIPGALLLIGLLALLIFCCCRKGKPRKAAEYAPAGKKQGSWSSATGPAGRKGPARRDSPQDRSATRDVNLAPYGSSAAAAGVGSGSQSFKGAGVGSKTSITTADMGASYAGDYKPPPPGAYDTGRPHVRAAPAAAMGAGAAAALTAAKRSSTSSNTSSNKGTGRPDSPTSSRSSGRALAGTAAAGAGAGAAAIAGGGSSSNGRGGNGELPVSRSMRVAHPDDVLARSGSTGSAGSGTLTPWESGVRPGGSTGTGTSSLLATELTRPGQGQMAAPASNTLASLGSMRGAAGAPGTAAAGGSATGGGAALAGSRSGSLQAPAGAGSSSGELLQGGSSATGWRSSVRPAAGQTGATSSMSNPVGKGAQQAERAKFWAQFQETWQQVRQTQNVDNEPGSPSSGTNWTDITDARTARH